MKNFLKKFLFVLLELVVITGVLWFIAERRGIKNFSQIVLAPETQEIAEDNSREIVQTFPEIKQEGNKKFAWIFKGIKYELSLNLDQAVYAYYQKQPKNFFYQGELPDNWEEEYYGMFLKINEKDQTISQLAIGLQKLGKQHGLNNDQLVELALAFVQSIAYDDSKADNILAKTKNEKMLYPFETLFQQKGVCSDKSLLFVAILREMGYGAALFAYDQENHMAVGVQCPKADSTYGSGYCFAETTSGGHKIGIIPQIDSSNNKTVEVAELSAFEQETQQQANLRELGKVTIFQATVGREYMGIEANEKLRLEIVALRMKMENLKNQLAQQKKILNQQLTDLQKQKKELDEMKNMLNLIKYDERVSEYNDLIAQYEKELKTYNRTVGLYNQAVARYNKLIKQ